MATATLIVGDDGSNTLQGSLGGDLIYGFNPDGPQGQVGLITATRVAAGLDQPLFAIAPPGDTDRLFIVEKTGEIKILDLSTNQVLATPFLDVSGEIATSGEQGLLGLAFDPDFADNGYVYVGLINTSGDTEVRRYQVSASDPNRLDPASATLVIRVDQPDNFTNHRGGWIGFGPDGYLYVALGDGGGGGDPNNNAQNIDSLLGKMLRLDVHGDDFPADPARNYAIPADNMFVGVAGADEIWALGLRNPWRPSFDRGLGDFYIADVGQGRFEEIDIGLPGANYGWRVFEGPEMFTAGALGGGTLTGPIHFYGRDVGASITGGYVYRGESDGLQGHYFFADFITHRTFTLHFDGTAWVATERTAQVNPDVGAINNPSSFGEDARGNLYLVDFDGDVFRLAPAVASADQADNLQGLAGDDIIFGGNGSDTVNGNQGNDGVYGGDGDDQLFGGQANDVVFGDNGNDRLVGDLGDDTGGGGNGNDILEGLNGDDLVDGDGGNDLVLGNQGSDTVLGDPGDDLLRGGQSGDRIDGEAGNDLIFGDLGQDSLHGGAGNDTFWFDAPFGTPPANPSPAGAPDLVDDFDLAGDDRLHLGAPASATNFVNSAASTATLTDAVAVADALMDGAVIYVTVNVTGLGPNTDNTVVFWDTDVDGAADEAVALLSIPQASLGVDDII
jgi:glucose/arabinose dehydrogenase